MNVDRDHPFFSAYLKIERADHHIDEFEEILRDYRKKNVGSLKTRRQRGGKASHGVGGRLPLHTPTIVGDAVHNLRCALDHAYCALVELNGATVARHTLFPFHQNQQSAKGSLNGHIQKGTTPSAKVLDFITDVIKPFEDDESELYALHKLDVADKHHLLIETASAMHIKKLSAVKADGSPAGFNMEGLSLIVPAGMTAIAPPDGGGFVAEGRPEQMFDIKFANVPSFDMMSVLPTLRHLSKLTKETVDKLFSVGVQT